MAKRRTPELIVMGSTGEHVDRVITFVEHPGVEIGLRRPRLRDSMLQDVIVSRLPDATGLQALYQVGFAKTLSRTVYVKGLELKLPTLATPPAELNLLYEKFLDMPSDIPTKWAEEAENLTKGQVPNSEKPSSQVTPAEQSDPNSSSSVPSLPTTSTSS